jgi:hypothetical protein
LDLGEPVVPTSNVAIVPDFEHALRFKNLQVRDDAVLPRLVEVAVGDEDRGAVPRSAARVVLGTLMKIVLERRVFARRARLDTIGMVPYARLKD